MKGKWPREIRLHYNFTFNFVQAELDSLLTDDQLSNVPIVILGNKIDMAGAASEDELRHYFGLFGQTTGKVRLSIDWREW